MPRFVILTHDHPLLHWDFLLERGATLRSWRLLAEPGIGQVIAAEPMPDHRLLYLGYEGPVSGNRGSVTRWDAGEYELLNDSAADLRVRLEGQKLRCVAHLTRTAGACCWRF